MKFYFVCCTRLSQADFDAKAALAISLKPFLSDHVRIIAAYQNTEGLSAVYNRVIDTLLPVVDPEDVFVFCHDDVLIVDYYWIDRLLIALNRYDVVGLAGSTKRVPRQPSWFFLDDTFMNVDQSTLSGVIGHGKQFPLNVISNYGAPDQEVELLDGLFIAATAKTLIQSGVRFDDEFSFHFYDMDFCRTARKVGLRLGTAALSVVHQSAGNTHTQNWRDAYKRYLNKWQS